ncbi:hypothetical protein M0Q50_05770 [bacterium]|jgi:hypothetical protein|nr:hypothetical protein [bacterium]
MKTKDLKDYGKIDEAFIREWYRVLNPVNYTWDTLSEEVKNNYLSCKTWKELLDYHSDRINKDVREFCKKVITPAIVKYIKNKK